MAADYMHYYSLLLWQFALTVTDPPTVSFMYISTHLALDSP